MVRKKSVDDGSVKRREGGGIIEADHGRSLIKAARQPNFRRKSKGGCEREIGPLLDARGEESVGPSHEAPWRLAGPLPRPRHAFPKTLFVVTDPSASPPLPFPRITVDSYLIVPILPWSFTTARIFISRVARVRWKTEHDLAPYASMLSICWPTTDNQGFTISRNISTRERERETWHKMLQRFDDSIIITTRWKVNEIPSSFGEYLGIGYNFARLDFDASRVLSTGGYNRH